MSISVDTRRALLVVLMTTSVLLAPATVAESETDAELIKRLNRESFESLLVDRDPSGLEELALDEYMVIAPGGVVETKAQAVAGVRTLDVTSMTISDERLLIRNQTAVLIGKLVVDGTMKPLGRLPPMKFMTVFISVEGEWKLMARSLTVCASQAIERGLC